jgi:hypothetical protein
MLGTEVAAMIKRGTGLDDSEIASLHPGLQKFYNNAAKLMAYQLVAEVVRSKACSAQVKVGDKLIFDPFLNPQKSTGIMCPRALVPVLLEISALWETTATWPDQSDGTFPEIVFRNVRCLDPGLEDGGVGGVVYRIHAEKKA